MRSGESVAMTAVQLAHAMRVGHLSPLEVMHDVLRRIERAQPVLNAFVSVCAEQALENAREAERMRSRGAQLGPLHGVPFSVKDLVATRGVRTTYGSLIFADHVPSYDATTVARLKQAGAIVLGKTVTTEFATAGRVGLTLTVRVAVKTEVASVKGVVYDFASDRLGSATKVLR